jgi:hypothetical protein
VILLNDEDDYAEITTHQRTWVTKLRKNRADEELEDLSYGTTTGGRSRIPAKLVSIRTKQRSGKRLSAGEKAKRAERLNATR